ncbi:MAG TPA: ATP-binding protein [Gemmatimonadaceae bacterium]|nr:ATP-binding protein [Gemmatimonadaceae bacterium]
MTRRARDPHAPVYDPRSDPPAERSGAERLLEGIIALAADAVVTTDSDYRIIIFNPAAERIFGYRRDDVLGESLDGLLPESARTAHHAHLERFRQSASESRGMGERGRVWGRRASGELFPAEVSISKVALGGAIYFTAVLRDVTQERRAEKEREALLVREHDARTAAEAAERHMAFLADASEILHSSLAIEETFDALLHLIVPELATLCAIDVLDATGRVKRAHVLHGDPAMQGLAERLGTYPRRQTLYVTRRAIEKGLSDLVVGVDDAFLGSITEDEDHLAILRGLGLTSLITVPLRVREHVLGALVFGRAGGVPPYTEADLSLAQALALRAASALENARLYDEARRAVRARDDVLGVVSHDLRTPLSVIAMCASSLLGESPPDPHERDSLETIQRSAHWAQRLIQDLLDVSAIEAGGLSLVREPQETAALVHRAVRLHDELAAERGIALVTELQADLPPVLADGDRVVQALGNLVGNALKFTPHGGTVRVGAERAGDAVRLSVADSGPGIPAEHAALVFDRFWTARRSARTRGTGMGLAIVRGIVEAHGGRAWLEPAPAGRGATFRVALPVAPAG